jgi:RNA polymerase sigma-54 factor
MALAPRLDLRQTQSLVMTPQLQQAIKLLALSSLEIESFIAEELERNPLLEMASGDSAGEADAPDIAETPPSTENLGSDQLMNDGDFGTGGEALDTDFSTENFEPGEGSGAGADGMLGMNGVEGRGTDYGGSRHIAARTSDAAGRSQCFRSAITSA